MYLTTHAASGLFLASVIPNPAAAFGAGFISHFVLDMIPHEQKDDLILEYPGDTNSEIKAIKRRTLISIADILLTLAIIWYAWTISINTGVFVLIFAGITGALLPDVILMGVFKFDNRFLRWYFDINNKLHFVISKVSIPRYISIVYQGILCLFFMFLAQENINNIDPNMFIAPYLFYR